MSTKLGESTIEDENQRMSTKNKWEEGKSFTVNTRTLKESTFWKVGDISESMIMPLRNSKPKDTCLTLCKCFPAQALQVYELAIFCKQHSAIHGPAEISGFFAIRDYYDRRRVYIFNNTTDQVSTIHFTKVVGKNARKTSRTIVGEEAKKEEEKPSRTVVKLRIVTPRRGILYGDLVFDYDLVVRFTKGGPKEELKIKGKSLFKGNVCPYNSQGKMICARIPIKGNRILDRMDLKFVRFSQGVEAMIEVHPPEGLNFRLTARIGDIADAIVLHDSKYSKANDHLKFVLVMPILDILELTFVGPNNSGEPQKIHGFSLYHGLHEQHIDLGSSKVKTTITWSRM